jgi:hypothetical protein
MNSYAGPGIQRPNLGAFSVTLLACTLTVFRCRYVVIVGNISERGRTTSDQRYAC